MTFLFPLVISGVVVLLRGFRLSLSQTLRICCLCQLFRHGWKKQQKIFCYCFVRWCTFLLVCWAPFRICCLCQLFPHGWKNSRKSFAIALFVDPCFRWSVGCRSTSSSTWVWPTRTSFPRTSTRPRSGWPTSTPAWIRGCMPSVRPISATLSSRWSSAATAGRRCNSLDALCWMCSELTQ